LPPSRGAARPHQEPARHGPDHVESQRHRPAANQPRSSTASHNREQPRPEPGHSQPTTGYHRAGHGHRRRLPALTTAPRLPPPHPHPCATTRSSPSAARFGGPLCRRRASTRRRRMELRGGSGPQHQSATTGGRENAPPSLPREPHAPLAARSGGGATGEGELEGRRR
jgi:hypothetical protein